MRILFRKKSKEKYDAVKDYSLENIKIALEFYNSKAVVDMLIKNDLKSLDVLKLRDIHMFQFDTTVAEEDSKRFDKDIQEWATKLQKKYPLSADNEISDYINRKIIPYIRTGNLLAAEEIEIIAEELSKLYEKKEKSVIPQPKEK